MAKLPTEGGAPYVVLVLAGMLPWFLFSSILSDASNSLILNANLIGKVYFPRILVPLSACAVAFVDFVVSLVLLLGMILWTGAVPTSRVLFLPLFVLLSVVASIGPSLYLAALNARYRDFRYVVPFLLQIGLYASPVGYSSSLVPPEWRLLFSLNPLVGIIDGFRWCLVAGPATLSLSNILISVAGSLLFLVFGVYYFRRVERSLADIL